MKCIIDKILRFIGVAIFGIGIGIPVTVICMSTMGGYNETVKEIIVWIVASAFMGLISSIFFINKFNLVVSTIIQCVGCFTVAISACALCGYIDNMYTVLTEILPVFVVVYLVIYLVGIGVTRFEAKQVNDILNK